MNAVATALRSAGVVVPTLRYRVWNWLRDHPEKTSEEIRTALGMTYCISTQLKAMEGDGLLKVFSDVRKQRHPMTGGIVKIKRYSCVNLKVYEPPQRKPPQRKPHKRPVAALPVAVERQMVDNAKTAAPVARHPVNLDNLTIKQARALYYDLKEIFK